MRLLVLNTLADSFIFPSLLVSKLQSPADKKKKKKFRAKTIHKGESMESISINILRNELIM